MSKYLNDYNVIERNKKLINFFLRAISSGLKFISLIFLAKLLTISSYSDFVLFSTYIAIGILVIGFDFYTYVHRDLLRSNKESIDSILINHVYFILISYCFTLPIFSYIFYMDKLEIHFIWYFYIILIGEHLSQELTRLLTTLESQLYASIVLFIRQGALVLISIPLMWYLEDKRNIQFYLLIWISSVSISIIFGLYILTKKHIKWEDFKIDLLWIIKGVKISFVFYISTLLAKMVLGLDKIILYEIANVNIVAAYALYTSIVFGIYAFLDPLVFSFSYQKIIKSIHKKAYNDFYVILKSLIKQVFFFVIVVSVVSWWILPLLLTWIEKETYIYYLYIFPIINLAAIFWAFSMISHYVLYAFDLDKKILFAQFMSVVVFFLSILFLNTRLSAELTISISILLSFLCLMSIKSMYAYKEIKQIKRIKSV